MPLTSGKITPIISTRLYDEGQQDPIVTDHGFWWTDVLRESVQFGSFELDSLRRPKLEFFEEAGLVNAVRLNLKDTLLHHFNTTGGEWEQRRPATGAPRAYRIVQYDSSPDIQYEAQSNYTVPGQVDFAFTLWMSDTPPDWDTATYEPYVQVEFGGKWAVLVTKTGAYLCYGTDLDIVAELGAPTRGFAYLDLDEMLFYVRLANDKLGVSVDGGSTYKWWKPPTAVAYMAPAKLTVSGQGGAMQFGLHQLWMEEADYYSPQKDTHTQRPLSAPTITATGTTRTGTSVALTDLSVDNRRYAAYGLTMTPGTATATPFTFYRSASVQRVNLNWPVTYVNGAGTYTTPWDSAHARMTIRKSRALSESDATLIIELDRSEDWPPIDVGPLRDRKIQILTGLRIDGVDPLSLEIVFTGYIVDENPYLIDGGRVILELTAKSAAYTLTSTTWTRQDVRPLGGQLLNEALDEILASEALNASYRSWHEVGDVFPLPTGTREEPFELIRPDETKFETAERLAGYAGLELGVLDDGTYVTVPFDYVSGTTHTYSVKPVDGDLWATAQALRGRRDYEENVTLVVVTGWSQDNGAELTAWARDSFAETSTASLRFAPKRHVIQEELRDTCEPGVLLSRTAALATKHFPLRREPPLEAFLNVGMGRRDKIISDGGGAVGIADGSEFVVLTLVHEISVNSDGSSDLKTSGDLWEIV